MPAHLLPPRTKLGENLRRARMDAGLNHRELAERAHLRESTLSYIEGGKVQSPGAHTLYAIAVALGVRMEDLMGVQRIERTTKGRVRARRGEDAA